MGDEVIGDVSALHYSAALQTPQNEKFVKDYRAKYGKVPSYYSEVNYAAAKWIDLTLAKLNGKYPGPTEFIKAMAKIKLDAPRGPVELDPATKSPIQNIYIKKVEKRKCSATTTTSSGTRLLRLIRPSARSGTTTSRNSWRSRSTAAISRRVNSASETDDPSMSAIGT